jgi:hypothetical protein
MPLPLGHSTIGFTTHSLVCKEVSNLHPWRTLAAIAILSNLPDLDVLLGLLVHGNGNAFHRGPTHSLLFALVLGLGASNAWRLWSKIPRFYFTTGFLLIFSHILADMAFTSTPISFFWPLDVHWSGGHSGLSDILGEVLFGNYQDVTIIGECAVLLLLNSWASRLKYRPPTRGLFRETGLSRHESATYP